MSNIIDKYDSLGRLADSGPITLELGCGPNKKHFGSLGIDVLDYPAVDIVGDVLEVLRRFPAGSVDGVYSSHFIEHMDDIKGLMHELSRIVKPNGMVEIVAPHFSNPYFYSDPTHRAHFGLYTFCYYAEGSLFSRQVPVYGDRYPFRINRVDLLFKSPRPFYIRYAMKWAIGKLFNSSSFMKEFYEENLCYLFPCYEVQYRLFRKPETEGTV